MYCGKIYVHVGKVWSNARHQVVCIQWRTGAKHLPKHFVLQKKEELLCACVCVCCHILLLFPFLILSYSCRKTKKPPKEYELIHTSRHRDGSTKKTIQKHLQCEIALKAAQKDPEKKKISFEKKPHIFLDFFVFPLCKHV